jgi:translation initiation factor 1
MAKKKFPLSDGIVFSTNRDFLKAPEAEDTATLGVAVQPLVVYLDTKHRAGKSVTLVSGFIGKTSDLDALGKLLKNHCGTGGSVKDGIIIVQGDQKGKIIQWLRANGYARTR